MSICHLNVRVSVEVSSLFTSNMLAKSILSVAACALLMSALLPAAHAAQDEDSTAGKQAEKQFAVELDPETFDETVAGNNVFVKFFAPW